MFGFLDKLAQMMINAKTLVRWLHKYVHMGDCVCDYICAGGLQALLLSAFLLTPVVDNESCTIAPLSPFLLFLP